MIKFEHLNQEQQGVVRKAALSWFQEHKNHVYKLINESPEKIAPTGSDLYKPELWKGIHWRWFLDNSFLL